jgi:Pentapeptide repeats (8 copies)
MTTMKRLFWNDVVSGGISGIVSGAILLFVASRIDRDLSDQQQQLENLRFVRAVATTPGSAMPFQSLDLQNQDLSGLRFGCRDEPVEAGSCLLRADFTGAQLNEAIMQNMDLSDAFFARADLRATNFSGSRLDGADLYDALHVDEAVLEGICYSETNPPRLPPEVDLPASNTGVSSAEVSSSSAANLSPPADSATSTTVPQSPVCTDGYYAP